MTCLIGQVNRQFSIAAGGIQIRAFEQECTDHLYIAVLCGGVERRIATLLAYVRICSIAKQEQDDLDMACRQPRPRRG